MRAAPAGAGCPPASGRCPCNEMPKVSSMTGTAAAPTILNGSSTASGSSTPVTATSTPSSEPMMIGFVTGVSRMRPTDARPRSCTSSTVRAIGAKTSSWSSTTGSREGRVTEDVRRDRDADVVRIHIPGAERADGHLGDRAPPDHARDERVERERRHRRDGADEQQRREQHMDFGVAEHREQEARRQDEEREPGSAPMAHARPAGRSGRPGSPRR